MLCKLQRAGIGCKNGHFFFGAGENVIENTQQ
jgi:hypothetical protein